MIKGENIMNIEMLKQIFDVCIIPLLGVLTAYVITYIQTANVCFLNSTGLILLSPVLIRTLL